MWQSNDGVAVFGKQPEIEGDQVQLLTADRYNFGGIANFAVSANEVYYLFDMPSGDFPGSSAIEAQAINGCLDAFEPYVGKEYDTSMLGVLWLTPTAGSWDEGDREIVCHLWYFCSRLFHVLNGSQKQWQPQS